MQIFCFLPPVLSGNIVRNQFHGPRAVKRDHGDDIFKFGGFEHLQISSHAIAFQLEDANRVALLQKLVNFFIALGQVFDVD